MPELTKEQKLAKLKNSETIRAEALEQARVAEAEAAALRQDLGVEAPQSAGGNGGGVEGQIAKADADAQLFEKMTPAERMNLYVTNRSRWQELMSAVEAVGTRRLMERVP